MAPSEGDAFEELPTLEREVSFEADEAKCGDGFGEIALVEREEDVV